MYLNNDLICDPSGGEVIVEKSFIRKQAFPKWKFVVSIGTMKFNLRRDY
jgi:hypothetical protein